MFYFLSQNTGYPQTYLHFTRITNVSPNLNETVRNITPSTNNFSIQIVNSFKYLGVILYGKFSFKDHTVYLKYRITRLVSNVSKLRHYIFHQKY